MITKNPELKKAALISAIITIIISLGGLYISPLCSLLIILCAAALFIVYYFTVKKRYDSIAELSELIDRTFHNGEIPTLDHFTEGELSILENNIRKLFLSIKEKNDMLLGEKKVLADSLADISHQIRTPLTSINIILSLMQKPDITEERRAELITELYTLLNATDKLVTNLLKIARLDAQAVHFDNSPVKVKDCVNRVLSLLEIALEIKNIEFTAICDKEIFTGDIEWTTEAVSNIIKNCIEHTPEGGRITLTAEETPIFTMIKITDTGSGIKAEDIPHLFERFYRSGGELTNNFGIGLNLANMIVKEQNGTLKAGNNPDSGAFFEIKFYKVTV